MNQSERHLTLEGHITKRRTRRLIIAVAIFYAILAAVFWYKTAYGLDVSPILYQWEFPVSIWNKRISNEASRDCRDFGGLFTSATMNYKAQTVTVYCHAHISGGPRA